MSNHLAIKSALVAVLFVACGKVEATKEQSPSAAPDRTEPAESQPKAPALPPLDLAMVSATRSSQSKAFNARGLRQQRASDYRQAIARYREALESDPGNLLARYNLATAFALAGEKAGALSILSEFARQPSCVVCQGRLVRARGDSDFDSLRSDPQFVAITRSATVNKIGKKAAARRISKALRTNDLRSVADLLHPRNAIHIAELDADCGADVDECTDKSKGIGVAGIATLAPTTQLARVKACTGSCCSLETPGDDEDNEEQKNLSELCFHRDSGGVLTLSSISYYLFSGSQMH